MPERRRCSRRLSRRHKWRDVVPEIRRCSRACREDTSGGVSCPGEEAVQQVSVKEAQAVEV